MLKAEYEVFVDEERVDRGIDILASGWLDTEESRKKYIDNAVEWYRAASEYKGEVYATVHCLDMGTRQYFIFDSIGNFWDWSIKRDTTQ